MIVIGADTHKRNHTLVAVDGHAGALRGQRQILATDAGSLDALRFAVGLDDERVWAIEDCRHVSSRLEAALMAAGEHVIRVPAGKTMQARKVSRQAGKSDPIDARAVALTVVRDGVDSFPVAFTDEHALEIRVLCDFREQLIAERTRMINRLRWHLVTIAPHIETSIAQAALKGPHVCARVTRQLARLPISPQLRVARRLMRRITEIGREERELLADLKILIQAHTPLLLEQQGCGTVTAAIIIGHTAGAAASPPTRSSPATPAQHPSRPVPATLSVIACTAAVTGNSTARSTSSRCAERNGIPKRGPISTANSPSARPSSRRSAASSAISPGRSGDCSTPQNRS